MSGLIMPGEADPATDGDMETTEQRLADEVGMEAPDDGGRGGATVSAPPPPD